MDREELHKQLIASYVSAFNSGDFKRLRTLFSPEAQIQGVLGWAGIEKALAVWEELHAAFAIELTVGAMVIQGHDAAVRYLEHGTFRGPLSRTCPDRKILRARRHGVVCFPRGSD